MEKKTKRINYVCLVLMVGLLIFLDQMTKKMAVLHLKDQPDIPILKGIFELSYVENRGAAFGMMQNRQTFFLIMTGIVLVGIVWIYSRLPMEKRYLPMKAVLIVLTAGAIGNLIDRVKLNYVVDFFYFKLIDFPVFNVADIYVVCAVFCLAFLVLFYYKEEEIDGILKVKKS